MVKINGELLSEDGKTVEEFLISAEYNKERIVVELNEEILSKEKYADTVLSDGDVVEIVAFMGGG